MTDRTAQDYAWATVSVSEYITVNCAWWGEKGKTEAHCPGLASVIHDDVEEAVRVYVFEGMTTPPWWLRWLPVGRG